MQHACPRSACWHRSTPRLPEARLEDHLLGVCVLWGRSCCVSEAVEVEDGPSVLVACLDNLAQCRLRCVSCISLVDTYSCRQSRREASMRTFRISVRSGSSPAQHPAGNGRSSCWPGDDRTLVKVLKISPASHHNRGCHRYRSYHQHDHHKHHRHRASIQELMVVDAYLCTAE